MTGIRGVGRALEARALAVASQRVSVVHATTNQNPTRTETRTLNRSTAEPHDAVVLLAGALAMPILPMNDEFNQITAMLCSPAAHVNVDASSRQCNAQVLVQ